MNYALSEHKDITVIALSGKIMGGPEAIEINDKFNQLIDENKLKIIIDLQAVEWMNSSGLGILIQAATLLKNNDGRMRLVNVSDRIKNLLKITKLSGIFETSDSLEQAAVSMGK